MENYPIADKFKNGLKKPKCKLVGADGNIFNLTAIARKSLNSMPGAYNEMSDRIWKSASYDKALSIMSDYLEIR